MKINILTLLIVLLNKCVFAQQAEPIIIGKKESIYSASLQENRKIWVYSPTNTSSLEQRGKRYPVLYLFDGEAHFYSTVGIIQQLSQANGNGVLPEMIVVAIENTNRFRDLVPAFPAAEKIENASPFVKFLSTELMPYIEGRYPAAPYKVVVGHSLGGLTAIDLLTNYPTLFNACIAIDPSLWFNNEKYLNHYLTKLNKQSLENMKLFVGIANPMPPGTALSAIKKDQTKESQPVRSILKFDQFLQTRSTTLKYAHKFYTQDRHNSVPLITEYDGLRFIFDYFFFDATEKEFTDSTTQIVTRLERHYRKVSSELGYKVSPPESLINYLGYDALRKKYFEKAAAFFKMNVENYSESSNVFDSYGDFFAARKDTGNAIRNYEKALTINRNAITLQKLNKLAKRQAYQMSLSDLKNYTGVYVLENFNLPVVVEIQNEKLIARVTGQADSELLPIEKDVFTVKGKQGYSITFKMNGSKPLEFTSIQPNGIFRAVFKNE
ncbi:MAG: alpha/beta hydrolase [Flavipsychrobacter sp.]|nr:alpha/beta hydrolase [Flavipsychrobacter sp.]